MRVQSIIERTLRVAALAALVVSSGAAGCTVQETSAPALVGPSGMSLSLGVQADRPILERGNFTTVRISARNHQNQPMSVAVRAEILAQGALFDYGRLSARDVTTGSDGNATITYFAPAPTFPATDSGDDVVTILVTPLVGGDGRGLLARQLDIRLVPQGTIIPNFPLVPSFTISNASPQAFTTVIFDASGSTRNGVPCLDQCGYIWTFGDGSSASGRVVEHMYTTTGQKLVYLRISDAFGQFVDSAPQTVNVSVSTALTANLTFSPTSPQPGLQTLFDARGSTGPDPIVEYRYSFGNPCNPGEVVTSDATTTHTYTMSGTFVARLTVRDAIGRTASTTVNVTVGGNLTGCPP
jgi:hypothetical protein